MSAPIAKVRPWQVTIGGKTVSIGVMSTDAPDSISSGSAVDFAVYAILGRIGNPGKSNTVPSNGDYLACAPVTQIVWDATNNVWSGVFDAGTTITTPVAKHMHTRKSIVKEWIDGSIMLYTNVPNQGGNADLDNYRLSTDNQNNSQYEFMYPRYYTVKEIQAASIYGFGGGTFLPIWAECFLIAQPVLSPNAGAATNPASPTSMITWQEVSPFRTWCNV